MKRLFLTVVAAMLLAVPAVQAQKVNREALVASLEKSDAEVQDAKKGAKASTWIKRAQTLYAAIEAPTKGIFSTMPVAMMKTTCGNPKSEEQVTLPTGQFTAYHFNWITVYVQGDKVVAWTQKKEVRPNLYEDLSAALNKAYELDQKQAPKIMAELEKVANFYKQEGNVNYDAANFKTAADAYRRAYTLLEHPAYTQPNDPSLMHNAGYLLVIDGASNPASFVQAEKDLTQALEAGYKDESGNIYYYLFHSYYGQAQNAEGDAKAALLQKAKGALSEGIEKYPTNERIIESFLSLYMSEPTVGDPAELIDMIKAAIERDPQSVDMWSSLALAHYQLKDFDAAMVAGAKAAELAPDSFDTNYRQGIFCAAKGDAIIDKMNKTNYTRQADYDADYALSNNAYREAVPWLEKAHAIMPDNRSVVETLKTIFFRLRDDEGMMDKYNEFNALLQQMQ